MYCLYASHVTDNRSYSGIRNAIEYLLVKKAGNFEIISILVQIVFFTLQEKYFCLVFMIAYRKSVLGLFFFYDIKHQQVKFGEAPTRIDKAITPK